MKYEDILSKELNDIALAEDAIQKLNEKWFVMSKERKIKILNHYISKKKILRQEIEDYYIKLKYGKD